MQFGKYTYICVSINTNALLIKKTSIMAKKNEADLNSLNANEKREYEDLARIQLLMASIESDIAEEEAGDEKDDEE